MKASMRTFCLEGWIGPDGSELRCFLDKGHAGQHNYLAAEQMEPMTLSGSKLLRTMRMAKEFIPKSAVVPFTEALDVVDALEARQTEAAKELQKVVDYCAWEGQAGVDPQIRLYNLLNGVMPVLYLLNGTDKTPIHGPTLDTEKNQEDGPST